MVFFKWLYRFLLCFCVCVIIFLLVSVDYQNKCQKYELNEECV